MAAFRASSKPKIVQKRISKVGTGYAFAEDVFIPNSVYEEIGQPRVGARVDLTVIMNDKPSPKYRAIAPKKESKVRWRSWQVGNDQIQVPTTESGSIHDHIEFSCYNCGEKVCVGGDIWRINKGCVWTRTDNMVKRGKEAFNKFKRTRVFDALCKSCGFNVATIYPEVFYNNTDAELPFPNAKLYICREQKDTGSLLNQLVFTGAETREIAEMAISRLSHTDDYSGPRVTSRTFDIICENEIMRRMLGGKGKCNICYDEEQKFGYRCPDNDCFTCNDCFSGHVSAHTSVADIGAFEKSDGKLPCPMKCGAFVSDQDVSKHAPGDPYAQYMKLIKAVAEQKGRTEQIQKFEEEKKREALLSAEEKKYMKHRQHITENCLTLRCPRCQRAFLDFDGCLALTCSGCSCAFCALCLSDCGDDAHRHVVNCKSNRTGNVYASTDEIQRVEKLRKKKLVEEYLSKFPQEAARIIQESERELSEIGIVNPKQSRVENSQRQLGLRNGDQGAEDQDFELALRLHLQVNGDPGLGRAQQVRGFW